MYGIYKHRIERDVLPKHLINMYFPLDQPLDIGVLPQSLQHLYLHSYKHIISIGVLPSSLKCITIYGPTPTNTDIGITLPKSISSLIIGGIQKDSVNQRKLALNLNILEINFNDDYGHPQTITTFQLTNSQDSLSFIKEFYPEYYSTHNLSKISDYIVDSQSNQIKGEYIIALLLHNSNNIL
ncbi:hypothetical protein PPL_11640 [Heterostelium album PN500]|uniref:Uncharacterized protein n=1 Tax=Heterostelium pallidum (strain ATCC 26659 / Pp 5 / PN500) TaxID=670386 RepID=D3BVB4_HETP5|nr:hypothetical protein PPL_11640 [Heterostelium album PN500]EFA74671.1 hypothetical protein PPL_11640 [Heterostelium album PN500]|eukprot:XP_020426805.1 hypothetical protein PPL_11640 [Heterostelium album PN500]